MPQTAWYKSWFNSPHYYTLYQHRDYTEAYHFIERLLNHLQPKAGSKMLDVACGKG
ncbi:MAG TPA: SAM-dependent methyltransferase, partial [Chitinophagaceae bacterium]|nr:SAM-dependent methyltransferase [Chitinophagaceae bacterium]